MITAAARLKGTCLPSQHRWQRTCDTLLMAPPVPDVPTPVFLVRGCTRCGLAEVWHGVNIAHGIHVTTHESLMAYPLPGGWLDQRHIWDKSKEG